MDKNNFFNKYKYYIIVGGAAIVTSLGYGLYCLFTGSSSNHSLSKWLEEYAKFIEGKLSKETKISMESIAYVINFISELEEYYFASENPNLENERLAELDNTDKYKYEELIFKTMESTDKMFHEAVNYVESRFGYTMSDLNALIHESARNGQSAFRELSTKCKFPYDKADYPRLEREDLKKIYLEFQNGLIGNSEEVTRELTIGQANPQYQEMVMMNIYKHKVQI